MNFGIIVLLVISGWALLSVAVAVTVGGIARARDMPTVTPVQRASGPDDAGGRRLAS
jgi:hypothetical protein